MGSNWLRDVHNKLGLQIWRIDSKSGEISIVTKGSHGVFRSDDSYIVLESRIASQENDAYAEGDNQQDKIYRGWIWLGMTSKRHDETHAHVSQLKETLGLTIDFKIEKQKEEDEEFTTLFSFKGGLTYVEPVVLKKQQNLRDDEHVRALYWIKGKKNARVKRVPVSAEYLNSGDVFVLDDNVKIWQWNGKKCNRMEKGKALDFTTRMRDERMNRVKADVIILQEGSEPDEFWQLLGGKPAAIKTEQEGGDDEAFENAAIQEDKLFCVSSNDGNITVTPVERDQHLNSQMLSHDYSYILDCDTEIFVWNGRNSPQSVRVEASTYAERLKSSPQSDGSPRPDFVTVLIISQSAEPVLFKTKFRGPFKEYIETPVHYQSRLSAAHKIAKVRQEKINVDALHHPEKYAAAKEDETVYTDRLIPNYNPGDLSELTIYYVKQKQMFPLPKDEYGVFFTHNAYILHYILRLPGAETKHIVYFWLGRHASIDDKGAASMLTADLAKNYGRGAIQVRVVQHKEPEHFLSHFRGKFCVLRGSRQTWAEERNKANLLISVRGKDEINVRGVEMENISLCLSSCDVAIAVDRLLDEYIESRPAETRSSSDQIAKEADKNSAEKPQDVNTTTDDKPENDDEAERQSEQASSDSSAKKSKKKSKRSGKDKQGKSSKKSSKSSKSASESSTSASEPSLAQSQEQPETPTTTEPQEASQSQPQENPTPSTTADVQPPTTDASLPCPVNRVFIWKGKYSNQFELDLAKQLATSSIFGQVKTIVEIDEGAEPEEFWQSLLAGNKCVATSYDLKKRARLFQCSERTSVFKATEVEGFTQDDLPERGAAILDGYDEVFVWFGKQATPTEKEMTLQTAEDYIKEADDGRPTDTPLYVVNSGEETPAFTSYFHGWERIIGDKNITKKTAEFMISTLKPLERVTSVKRATSTTIKNASNQKAAEPIVPVPQERPEKNPLNPDGIYIDYDRLRVKPLHPSVKDPTKLESYLAPSEFVEIFKMTPEQFYSKPKWKQLELKKAVGLF